MSCIKCTTTPKIPEGRLKLFINASHPYILDKIRTAAEDSGLKCCGDANHITAETDDFKEVIRKTSENPCFTTLEKESIQILPLGVDEVLDFGKAASAKSLESWGALLKAKDLVWILENGSLTIHFQPIVSAGSLDIYAYECLARGVLPDASLMSPFQMFETARKTGMLFNLDRQCRETAIKTSAVKNINKNIFINFQPSSIYNPEFCLRDTVKWANQLEFDPSTIVFEVVETDKVESIEHLINIQNFYKQKGFRTALDDVGSGYSSLNLFASLHPDIIKIDMELVRDVHKSDVKKSVARALIGMAKDAGCRVLAEGIENADECEWFIQAGVDYLQGYYFGRASAEPVRRI